MKRVVIIICMGITILFLLSSCRKNEKAKTAELCRELENSVMLSPAFDSLVKVSMGLPNFFRSKVLLVAGRCYSTKVEQMQQARIYLREAYRIAPRDVKNLVALELTRLYGSLICGIAVRKRPFVLSAGYLLRWCLPGRRRLNSITWELVFLNRSI